MRLVWSQRKCRRACLLLSTTAAGQRAPFDVKLERLCLGLTHDGRRKSYVTLERYSGQIADLHRTAESASEGRRQALLVGSGLASSMLAGIHQRLSLQVYLVKDGGEEKEGDADALRTACSR